MKCLTRGESSQAGLQPLDILSYPDAFEYGGLHFLYHGVLPQIGNPHAVPASIPRDPVTFLA